MQAIAQPFAAAPGKLSRQISYSEFVNRYLKREDGFKYEWVGGVAVKTSRSMDQSQAYILKNLLEFFFNFKLKNKTQGSMLAELDTFYLDNHRRPDILYLTAIQIEASRNGQNSVPKFVAEVISKNDQMNRAVEKMEDYRRAGVEVVWHIFPNLKAVHVYHGKKMVICTDGDLCSAEPAIPGFVMEASAVFE